MDIYFFCGSCGQNLVVDDAGAGLTIQCPQCRADLTVPGVSEPKSPPPAQPKAAPTFEKDKTSVLRWVPPKAPSRKDRSA